MLIYRVLVPPMGITTEWSLATNYTIVEILVVHTWTL